MSSKGVQELPPAYPHPLAGHGPVPCGMPLQTHPECAYETCPPWTPCQNPQYEEVLDSMPSQMNPADAYLNYAPATPKYPAAWRQQPCNTGFAPWQNVMVTSQPAVHRAPVQCKESNYLAYSIFTMLCCCFPLGVAALVFSFKTHEANIRGDAIGALSSSQMARTLNHVALAFGILIAVAWISAVLCLSLITQSYFPPSATPPTEFPTMTERTTTQSF